MAYVGALSKAACPKVYPSVILKRTMTRTPVRSRSFVVLTSSASNDASVRSSPSQARVSRNCIAGSLQPIGIAAVFGLGVTAIFAGCRRWNSLRATSQPSDDESLRDLARQVFRAGCDAADPATAAQRALRLSGNTLTVGDGSKIDMRQYDKVLVVGVGKACVRFAEGVEAVLGDKIDAGFLITKYEHSKNHSLTTKFQIREANHPTPDAAGEAATKELIGFVEHADSRTLVLCLITGGGTALLGAPHDGLTLEEYIDCNKVLLACGCPIQDKNAVLKHLNRVTGGKLAQAAAPAKLVTLLVSDVVGDPLDVIASGPTVPDESTFQDCKDVLNRYCTGQHRLPAAAMRILEDGVLAMRPENPKVGSEVFKDNIVFIAASNENSVNACVEKARMLGFNTLALSSFMEGEAVELAKAYVGIAKEVAKNGRPVEAPVAIIGGGETTCTLPANAGWGGRSQALALSALESIDCMGGVALLAGGTDGGDGYCEEDPPAAGAVVCGGDAALARNLGLSVADSLTRADSYHFFKNFEMKMWGRTNVMHLRDGPTGTNVMDLVVVLVVPPETQQKHRGAQI